MYGIIVQTLEVPHQGNNLGILFVIFSVLCVNCFVQSLYMFQGMLNIVIVQNEEVVFLIVVAFPAKHFKPP